SRGGSGQDLQHAGGGLGVAVSRGSLHLLRSVAVRWDRRVLQRIAIVGVAIVVTAYGASHPDLQPRVLLLLLGSGATIVLIRWPQFGIACLIASAILIPF